MTDKSAIIVKPSTAQAFETLWKRGRVLFFSAPCGFGKTVLADTLLDGRPVLRLNAADTGFALPSLEDAWDILLIDNIQDMQEERELTRFLPNMDAMLCRIALHTGDLDEADVWYRVKAPREPMHINILKRYQYFTQAMVELANGKPDSALLTLTPMEPYCTACMRYIDTIHLKVLTAIALYQKRDEAWREPLTAALALAEEYRFIRTVSVYGAAVLPLLDALEWSGNAKWHKRLMADVRAQAAIYPRFLQPRLSMSEALTAAEMQVLRLTCADKSNAEIGEILSIRVSTVKSHVSSVLSKLGVNRRSEARTAAKKLWLISEDQ